MADKKRRAPVPSSYSVQIGGREISNPAYVEPDGPQPGGKLTVPLPDYETLFPQKRHGVQGQTRWDHIIAEVNQKHRDSTEMSVDGPEEPPIRRTPLHQEGPAVRHHQTQPQETRPASSKRTAAPAPPKSVAPSHPPESSQRQSESIAFQSFVRRNLPAVPETLNTEVPSRGSSLSVMSRGGERKALQPPTAPRSTSLTDMDTPDYQRKVLGTVNKEGPAPRPRQRASGKEQEQEDSAVTSSGSIQTSSRSRMSSVETKGSQAKTTFEYDPFPTSELLPKDPWAQPKRNQEVDDLFTDSLQNEQKVEDRGMTLNDLDEIFSQEKDLFADFNGTNSKEHNGQDASPAFQRKNSQRRKPILPPTSPSDNKASKPQKEPAHKEQTTITAANQAFSARGLRNEPITPKLPADQETQHTFNGEDQFGAEPFTVTSALSSLEPLQVVMEEPASQAGSVSGGKAPLRAWVSPTDVQNSYGGGLALTQRRPHPVKPMSSESQYPISSPAVKEIKVRDSTPGKTQVVSLVDSGPYTQLTQEELITLVVRQQADLSKKDTKIVELEEYIDNLLVRVIDEQPSILQSLTAKPV